MKLLSTSLLIVLLLGSETIQAQSYPKLRSDSIVEVTTDQIRAANIIFSERDKFKAENSELYSKINSLNSLNSILEQQDSVRVLQLNELNKQIINYKEANENLTKTNSKLKKKSSNRLLWAILATISSGILIFVR